MIENDRNLDVTTDNRIKYRQSKCFSGTPRPPLLLTLFPAQVKDVRTIESSGGSAPNALIP